MASRTDNPFDALMFELKHIEVKKWNSGEPMGIFVKALSTNSQPYISRVADGSPAAVAGIKGGDYVVAVSGHRVDTKQQMAEEVGRISDSVVRMEIARRRQRPIDARALGPPGAEPRNGFLYHVCRLDPIRRPNLGLSMEMADKFVTVKEVTRDGSAFWSGLQARDRLMTIGEEPVRDLKHCEQLLKANEGKLADILIERPADAVVASADVCLADNPSLSLQRVSMVCGVAAAGVPETPPEVKNMMQNKLDQIMKNIRKGIKPKRKQREKTPPSSKEAGADGESPAAEAPASATHAEPTKEPVSSSVKDAKEQPKERKKEGGAG